MSQWVRLWEDMPTDPKWRVIARRADRPIAEVIAVFVFMMTNAGASAERGTLSNWDDEDVATALDIDANAVERIRTAMNGKTLDGQRLIDWKRIRDPFQSMRLPESQWSIVRNFVFARDDFTCVYCGERGGRLECDHVIPVSRGGGHSPDNLATACFSCNRSKRDKLLSEWIR